MPDTLLTPTTDMPDPSAPSPSAASSDDYTPTVVLISALIFETTATRRKRRISLLSNHTNGLLFSLSPSTNLDVSIAGYRYYSVGVDPSSTWSRAFGMLRLIWLAISTLRRQEASPDVIVTYGPYRTGIMGAILKMLFSCKLIVEINGDFHSPFNRSERTGFIKPFLMATASRLSLSSADAIKVLNSDQYSYYRSKLPDKPIYHFPNFVLTSHFSSLDTHQGRYLLAVGYPFHLKGIDLLIRAFKKIHHRHEPISLRIMGHCPDDELAYYEKLAGGDADIVFIEPGPMEKVGRQMKGCYALVHASRSEAMGRVQVEAMACGKPIVASRTNGGQECVVDGTTGLLFDVGDVDDLADKLDMILGHPERALEMGAAGRKRFRARYSEEKHIENFVNMINDIAECQRSRL